MQDYFKHISDSQRDLACEIIIELGDMDFWNDKDNNYKIVSDDLYKNGIFDDNDNKIANNIYRKVNIPNESKTKKNKNKNDRF